MNCAHCNALLGMFATFFALQGHGMEYSRPGETPSGQQAVLTSRVITTLARYCSSVCCKHQLPEQLEGLRCQQLSAQPRARWTDLPQRQMWHASCHDTTTRRRHQGKVLVEPGWGGGSTRVVRHPHRALRRV